MKNLKNNKKGFTLIELLAVIVILAILVAVAVPATMKYLASSRTSTFASNANQAISAVRTDIGVTGPNFKYVVYTIDNVNNLLDKELKSSPFGSNYTKKSYILATSSTDANGKSTGVYTYKICLVDGNGNGINQEESGVVATNVASSGITCDYSNLSLSGDVYYASTDAAGLNQTSYSKTVPTVTE